MYTLLEACLKYGDVYEAQRFVFLLRQIMSTNVEIPRNGNGGKEEKELRALNDRLISYRFFGGLRKGNIKKMFQKYDYEIPVE